MPDRGVVRASGASIADAAQEHRTLDTATSIATYWYFHLPNFILAALMYTMLGRVAARPDGRRGFTELYLAIFLPDHRSRRRASIAVVTPKVGPLRWCCGCSDLVWLFWLRVVLHYSLLLLNLAPRLWRSGVMNRNFYFIGIAFFGMINGIFNQFWLIFALLYVQILACLVAVWKPVFDADARILDGLDRHGHSWRDPAAIYERVTGASELNSVSLWIWLAGTAILTLPAAGNFLQIGLDRCARRLRALRACRYARSAKLLPERRSGADGSDAPYCL